MPPLDAFYTEEEPEVSILDTLKQPSISVQDFLEGVSESLIEKLENYITHLEAVNAKVPGSVYEKLYNAKVQYNAWLLISETDHYPTEYITRLMLDDEEYWIDYYVNYPVVPFFKETLEDRLTITYSKDDQEGWWVGKPGTDEGINFTLKSSAEKYVEKVREAIKVGKIRLWTDEEWKEENSGAE